jgi:isocitrate dehydrogenase kinase/phosphatase
MERTAWSSSNAWDLIDAQEFEHLEFLRWRFSEALLDELSRTRAARSSCGRRRRAAASLRGSGDAAQPVRAPGWGEARRAVIDYGAAIKELAAANIFPGDFLLKNFGVTRHGRVVFYDYDELCLLEQCRFRELPAPRTPEEDLDPEPWFTVGEDDVFPEEFRRFLGLPHELRRRSATAPRRPLHRVWWQRVQERLAAGELMDVFPYSRVATLIARAARGSSEREIAPGLGRVRARARAAPGALLGAARAAAPEQGKRLRPTTASSCLAVDVRDDRAFLAFTVGFEVWSIRDPLRPSA